MLTIREDVGQAALNATRQENGSWRCNVHGRRMIDFVKKHSLWFYPMDGGTGAVVEVRHLFCPSCHPVRSARPPEDGDPIYDIQLIDAKANLAATGEIVQEIFRRAQQKIDLGLATPSKTN